MRVSELVKAYQDETNCLIGLPDDETDPCFCPDGCDILANGLGNDLWEVKLVDRDTLDEIGTLEVCMDVLDYLANDEDHDVEYR
jgi:hypothetical protein